MRRLKAFILSHFEGALIILIVFGILAIAFLVRYKLSFLNFFFLPVILSGYFLGKRKAILTGFFCIALVILYQVFFRILSDVRGELSFDEVISFVTWGSFLVLTAAIIGSISEQRESRIKNLRRSYVGVLDILHKYLEVADERRPRSLRVSLLAGKIARAIGLETTEVENIKSAALLYEAGDLRSSLPLFEEVSDFVRNDVKASETHIADREQVLLNATVSLLKTIEPLLVSYFHHYVKEADNLDKNLNEIPMGSSIIALADLYYRISTRAPLLLGGEEIKSLDDVEKLSGRTFPASTVQALRLAVSTS